MKTIPKLTKRKREYNPNSKGEWIRKNIYNTTTWRYIREGKLMNDIYCQQCLLEDKLTLANEVHHVVPISTGNTEDEMKELAFDYDNLMCLCNDCHIAIHNKMRKGGI